MTTSNGFLSREDLLKTAERRYAECQLPTSGKNVRIQSLTEGEYAKWASGTLTNSDKARSQKEKIQTSRRRLFIACLVDANGNRLLTPSDVPALAEMDAADAAVLQDACIKHCGMDNDEVDALVKNSVEITEGDSPTD